MQTNESDEGLRMVLLPQTRRVSDASIDTQTPCILLHNPPTCPSNSAHPVTCAGLRGPAAICQPLVRGPHSTPGGATCQHAHQQPGHASARISGSAQHSGLAPAGACSHPIVLMRPSRPHIPTAAARCHSQPHQRRSTVAPPDLTWISCIHVWLLLVLVLTLIHCHT